MREIRLEIVPRPEGGVAIIYEKSEQGLILLEKGRKEMRTGGFYVAIVAIYLQIIWEVM
jgi:hypothetical protein